MSLLAGLGTCLMAKCECIKTVYKLVLQDQISHRYSLKLQGFIKFIKIPKDSLDGKKTDSDTTKLNAKTPRDGVLCQAIWNEKLFIPQVAFL